MAPTDALIDDALTDGSLTDEEREYHESVDLKDPGLAAFLAWLVPGLGHLYQGRTAKAGLFFVCIMGTFLYGLYLGSDFDPDDGKELGWGRVVYFSWRPEEKRLAYLCQVGIGLPALPDLTTITHGNPATKPAPEGDGEETDS